MYNPLMPLFIDVTVSQTYAGLLYFLVRDYPWSYLTTRKKAIYIFWAKPWCDYNQESTILYT
jgi:hypothetical protein